MGHIFISLLILQQFYIDKVNLDNRQFLHFKQLYSIKFFSFNNLEHEHLNYGT